MTHCRAPQRDPVQTNALPQPAALFRLQALSALLMAAGLAHSAAPLPEGGQVAAGSGSISRQGQTLTVQQTSARLALDWQSFSVGAGHTVQFVQPSAQSVALNRVLGSEVSVLQGRLQANGQVFLLNPNGILFTPGAQVQVGGLLASTLNLDTADFMDGRYALSGNSTQSVVNQGLLQAATGGSVALVAARVENAGQIEAPQGRVLMGAGQRVRVDLGGPVPIEIDEGALQARIDQSGAIRADGGLVYLTAKAAGDLASAAINHTGITEARSLASGERGEIWLMGDMARGSVQVGGRLDASAPLGGDGGFIETSAAQVKIADGAVVSTLAASGRTGTWLIDPNDYVIAASGGDITGAQLNSALATSNVTIQSAQGAGGTGGDILVNDALNWGSANALTLSAFRDIHINANVSASQGTLKLHYGQGAINNSNSAVNPSRVHINGGAEVSLSAGNHFYTKLGSDGIETAWTVITALGTASSLNDGTLQGINGRTDGNYVLGADIDASATTGWNGGAGFMPLGGTGMSTFPGRFDGLGHSISNLYINRPNDSFVGFIGLNDPSGGTFTWSPWNRPTDVPQVANLRLLNVNITGGGTVGAIAGEFRNASIVNVYASGTVTSSGGRVGGLTGNHKYSVLSNSISEVNVIGSSGVGGLIGEFEGDSSIVNSYASGTVGCPSGGGWCSMSTVGGLVGNPGWGTGGTVTNSYYNTAVNTNVNMRDRALYGKTPAEIKAAAIADWSDAIWDTSGSLPQLRRYTAIPVYGQPVAGNSDPDAQPSVVAVGYTLGVLGSPLSYNGSEQSLSGLWSAASIFGSSYGSWVAGTDYVFVYNGSQVTGFTAAGVYGNISIEVLKSGYSLANSGNTAGSLTINPAALTVRANSGSKVYGSADPTLGYSIVGGSLYGSDVLSGSLSRVAGENVGSYAVSASGLSNSNYTITSVNGALSITPRPITVTVDSGSKVYGNADPTLGWQLSSGGLIGGDTLSGSLSRVAGENVGSYAVSAAGLSNSNYTITSVNGALSITPRPITVTVDSGSKVYGNADPALGWQLSSGSLVGGDTLGGSVSRVAGENVGSYAVSASGLSNSNYTITSVNGALSITPRPITVTVDSGSKVYGSADPALGWQLSSGSLVGGDTLSGSLSRVAGENVGSYAVSAAGLSNSNYTITSVNGALSITPRPITVTVDSGSKVYGNADPALGWQLSSGSLVGGDTLGGSVSRAAGENVGSYAVSASGLSNSNYTITSVNGALSITPRPITVTVDSGSKVYGNADPALGWQLSSGSLVGGDTLGGSVSRAAGENVGSYAVSASGLSNSNYTITSVNGALSITPRPITVTVDSGSKVYGNADPALGWQLSSGSLVGGDTLGGSVSRAAGENVGSYAVSASGLSNGNYTITSVNGALSITPRPITVTADSGSKVYGSADPTLTWRLSSGSLVAGDALSGALSRTAGEDYGRHAITLGTLGHANYAIGFVGGVLDILPDGLRLQSSTTLSQQATGQSASLAANLGGSGGGLAGGSVGSPTGSGGLKLVPVTDSVAAAVDSTPTAVDSLGYVRVLVVNGGLRLP